MENGTKEIQIEADFIRVAALEHFQKFMIEPSRKLGREDMKFLELVMRNYAVQSLKEYVKEGRLPASPHLYW